MFEGYVPRGQSLETPGLPGRCVRVSNSTTLAFELKRGRHSVELAVRSDLGDEVSVKFKLISCIGFWVITEDDNPDPALIS